MGRYSRRAGRYLEEGVGTSRGEEVGTCRVRLDRRSWSYFMQGAGKRAVPVLTPRPTKHPIGPSSPTPRQGPHCPPRFPQPSLSYPRSPLLIVAVEKQRVQVPQQGAAVRCQLVHVGENVLHVGLDLVKPSVGARIGD